MYMSGRQSELWAVKRASCRRICGCWAECRRKKTINSTSYLWCERVFVLHDNITDKLHVLMNITLSELWALHFHKSKCWWMCSELKVSRSHVWLKVKCWNITLVTVKVAKKERKNGGREEGDENKMIKKAFQIFFFFPHNLDLKPRILRIYILCHILCQYFYANLIFSSFGLI